MKECHGDIEEYMDDYLDGDITDEHAALLKEHIAQCSECRVIFQELNKTVAFLQSTTMEAPSEFTKNVMSNLPRQSKRSTKIKKWLQHNPVLIAASMFILLMGGTMFSYWEEDQQFSFSKDPNLVVHKQTVIVPAGKTMKGNLVVRNGDVKVEGKVDGNVTVIHGENYLAGAGEVTGEIEEIDQIFEWLWFRIKGVTSGLLH